jgi:hypothetical protein
MAEEYHGTASRISGSWRAFPQEERPEIVARELAAFLAPRGGSAPAALAGRL